MRNSFSLGDFCFTVVQVEQTIFPVAHAQLVHIRELTQAMARFDSFDKVVVVAELRFGHGVYQIDAGGVDGADVGRCQNSHIRCDDWHGIRAFAVTGNRHIAHNVDVHDVISKEVDGRLGGFGHAFHQLLFGDRPQVVRTRYGVDFAFSNAAIGAANAQVFVRSTEAAHGVALEVGECEHGVIVKHVSAHMHFVKPFAAGDGQGGNAFLVHNVYGAERPAVVSDGLAMPFGGVAVAFVVGVGFHDGGIGQVFGDKILHPAERDDVGAVFFASVQLDGNLATKPRSYFGNRAAQAFR